MATDAQVDGLFAAALVERDPNAMAAQVDGLHATGLIERDPNPMAAQVDGFFAIALVSRTKGGVAPPLQLRRRPDDNSTGSPLLPRFHGTVQRTPGLGGGNPY